MIKGSFHKKKNNNYKSFPVAQLVKNLPANAGDVGLIPKSGRPAGEGNGNPLQYSYLGNPMDRGARQATIHGVVRESDMIQDLNNNNIAIINIMPVTEASKHMKEKWTGLKGETDSLTIRVEYFNTLFLITEQLYRNQQSYKRHA